MSLNISPDESARRRSGLGYGISAYLMWGFLPLLFVVAAPTGAFELVAHRVIWSLVFCAILLTFTGGFVRTWEVIASGRTFWLLALAAVLIAINWTTFIYGVETQHLVEVSLGYYLNPLISIALGVLFLGERLRPLQWAAVSFGALAVIIVGMGIGRVPFIAFGVAISFGIYGLVKNRVGGKVGALESMTVETAVLTPPSLALLIWLAVSGLDTFTGFGTGHVLIILLTGPVTAIPLILFGAAARRIPLSWVGMLQYIAPTMQFIIGVAVLGEAMSVSQWIGFLVIWIAVILFSIDLMGANRRRRL
ncbi:chloramphenicol-sensitive protein RarD [Brevibacterium sanguinis]|uniref:Chloramphenicol-sensitive protein RarD n=2 Tax=Brevibacterium TaxID=1696 RepID=A0A366IEC6_9MICO|nr:MULTISPECIES: EamA family transporter RarD [Brevibacterium]RBP63182.1 chloramphenicol-sensitive protein RarD [Brevibacterium sanguinis]RBP69642.1 chloramphenicol-sensitive protein RarD [Brevibacterium celere]